MRMKICGVRSRPMLETCVQNGVDFVGLNFVDWSRRCVGKCFLDGFEKPKGMLFVGVFENESKEEIERMIAEWDLDWVQLHGNEDVDFLKQFEVPVVKGIALRTEADVKLLHAYCGKVEVLLLDGALPGSGMVADNALLVAGIAVCKKAGQAFAVAGGINAGNVEMFLKTCGDAVFLDAASAVEEEGGKFSEKKLSALLFKIEKK
jgi:phosphoribosylanthranilate isomerase